MKKNLVISFLTILAIACSISGRAQETDVTVNTSWDQERHSWEAQWVTHPTASVLDYGVFRFTSRQITATNFG